MIKIYNSSNIDKTGVTGLWRHSFGDTKEYVEFFLENCPGYLCFTYWEDDRIVSMFFLLDGELAGEKSKYLYAACTHSDYRRRGLMENLIDAAVSYCTDNGFSSIFLVPANEKLYNYYSKFGFTDSFKKKKFKFTVKDIIDKNPSVTIEVSDIVRQKKRLLKSVDGFTFNDDVMAYTVKEHINNGGRIYSCSDSDGEMLAFYYYDKDSCVVKELLTDFCDINGAVYKHFHDNNIENVYILTPIVYNSKDILGEYTRCGMVLPLNNSLKNYLQMHSELYASMYLD